MPDLKNSEARMVLPQFAYDSDCCIKFWVNTRGVMGWLAGGREGDPKAFLFLLAGV